ncbi:MAG: HAD hydrolase-like protein [Gemmatimonadales bacterium]|nr:HAD hydrolase-like protein [Gemmatimonadales bacterium]
MRRLILFDIDGTLLLTAGAGRRAVLAALHEAAGGSSGYDRVRFDGKTDPQIIAELLHAAGDPDPCEPGRLAALCERYVTLLEQELAAGTSTAALLPGVPALLDALAPRTDVVTGLLTGNLARGAALKLRAAGLDPARFAVGAYGSDSGVRAELPPIAAARAAPLMGRVPGGHEVVIIGDTPADLLCGRGIGARAIGVCTGAYGRADLLPHEPHAVFDDLTDTAGVLAALLDD